MSSKHFIYDAYSTSDALNNVNILLKQSQYKNGKESVIEIPIDDVQEVLSVLRRARDEAENSNDANTLMALRMQQPIAPEVLNIMTNLSLSGMSVMDLAYQFKISEDVIKYNLEKKGIILMEEI